MAEDTRKTILIVDDEKDFVRLLKFRLEKNGYNVLAAYDGKSGLRAADKLIPDLIILDINLPKIGGVEFYNKICTRYNRPRFPVLVLTARGELEDLFKSIEADGFMHKPFEIDALLKEIERIISTYSGPIVFLVDFSDNPHAQHIQKALKKDRYKVIAVENIAIFEEELARNIPSFILMEYIQSDISGEDFIRKIKELSFPHIIPIIAYSYSGIDYKEKSLAAGADEYIKNPKDYGQFVSAIELLRSEER